MPHMITNADGSQSEVYSKEEMTAAAKTATDTATEAATTAATKLVDEKIDEYKKQNPPAAKEIEDLKEKITAGDIKIKELEEAAKGDGDGDDGKNEEQIKRLRKEKDDLGIDLNKKIENMGKQLSAVVGDAKTELIQAAVKSASQSDVEAAGGKEEFQKKLELKFDSFKGESLTRTQIAERVTESVTLITGNKPKPGMMDGATGGGAKGDEDHGAGQGKEVSDATKKVGAGLGITDADRTKYGPGGEKHTQSSSTD